MNRVATALLALCLSAGAAAQLRTIPSEAQRGYIRHVQGSTVTVDGKEVALAPGATIRGPNNLILVPTALPADGALGEYLLDRNGQIARVWLLSPEEADREKPGNR